MHLCIAPIAYPAELPHAVQQAAHARTDLLLSGQDDRYDLLTVNGLGGHWSRIICYAGYSRR